jgi:hypothetical protein
MVPPLQNGNADLDKAYDMAVFADPAVRAKAFAAQATSASMNPVPAVIPLPAASRWTA